MLHKNIIITLASVAILPFATHVAYAEEFVITGNGAGSSNTVEVSSATSNNVSQSNEAAVANNITTTSNTGNNQANNNLGNVAVETGNTNTSTDVTNNLNNSIVDSTTCCTTSGGSITVTGNGADSTSVVGYASSTNNTTHVHQTATINNVITGTANTGGNKANNNLGNVNIFTGSIKVNEKVKTNVNESFVKVATGGTNIFDIKVAGNGAGSINLISLTNNTTEAVTVENNADIFNQSVWNLITGNNEANGNNGDVTIKTGDIEVSVTIENNANHSEVIVDCGCTPTPPPPPACVGDHCNPNPPSNGGGGSNNGGGSSGGSSSPSNTPSKDVLPVTGTPWMILLLLGNVLLLLFGTVLRLRSGNSPSQA